MTKVKVSGNEKVIVQCILNYVEQQWSTEHSTHIVDYIAGVFFATFVSFVNSTYLSSVRLECRRKFRFYGAVVPYTREQRSDFDIKM